MYKMKSAMREYYFCCFAFRVKQIQNELGTQILADFEDALSVKGVKVTEVLTFL